MMKGMITGVLGCLLVLSGMAAFAQPSFTAQDVPSTPGTAFEYYAEQDAAVNVGASGANRF